MLHPRINLPLLAALGLAAACGDTAQVDGEGTGASSGAGPDSTTATPTTSATGDDSSTGIVCPANAAPDAPTVLTPLPGRIDVIPATLTLSGSPFADPDAGDVLGAVEAEIWRIKDGVVDERVWHAERIGDTLAPLGLADGSFDAGPDGALADWKDHVVRLRYRDERGSCSAFSEWSPDLQFRTDDMLRDQLTAHGF